MTRKAFTLIELLVVIAIIAILAAILFPVFISARGRARTIKCMAHGKQLGQATMMYLGDNNDRFPSDIRSWPAADASGNPVAGTPQDQIMNYLASITWHYYWAKDSSGRTWENWSGLGPIVSGTQWMCPDSQWRLVQFKKYVKSEDIWICPDPNTMYAKRYAYGYRNSWCIRDIDNFLDGDRGFNDAHGVGRTVSEVQDLDRTALLDDGSKTACGSRYMPPTKKIMWQCYALGRWACGGRVGDGKWPWVFPSYAHARGSVFVYADGHAAYRDMGQGWAPLGYTKLDLDQTP